MPSTTRAAERHDAATPSHPARDHGPPLWTRRIPSRRLDQRTSDRPDVTQAAVHCGRHGNDCV